jgi:8-oxo-dGTP pyrophosphatase MutT (NUDIX family)
MTTSADPAASDRSISAVAARPAATIMLLRDGAAGLEVFMTVRHHAIEFASGALVFPGGRVEDSDHAIAEREGLPRGRFAPGFFIAGIRETFEECGILLARPRGSDGLVRADRVAPIAAAFKQRVADDHAAFADLLAAEDLAPAADLLVPFAHWITPKNQRKRFDTVFFLAAAPADQAGSHDGAEAVDSVWINPAEAIAASQAGRYKMLFPTQMNLLKLGRHATAAAAMARAREAPLVTVEPELLSSRDGIRQLRIPEAADYGGSVFTVDLPPGIV